VLRRTGLVKCQNITDVSNYTLRKPRNGVILPDSPSSGAPGALERVHFSYCTNLTLPRFFGLCLVLSGLIDVFASLSWIVRIEGLSQSLDELRDL
jgi:hypothetical protein